MDKTNILVKAIHDWENYGEHTQFGLCCYFRIMFNIDNLEHDFPEIYDKRTNVISYPWTQHYWFRNRQERINALKEILNMHKFINKT